MSIAYIFRENVAPQNCRSYFPVNRDFFFKPKLTICWNIKQTLISFEELKSCKLCCVAGQIDTAFYMNKMIGNTTNV